MSNVAKLKKQAAEFELKKQFDKALAIYVKMLESFDPNDAELDVALFNRVGDLMLRQGNVADAVDYYERAVDHYAETGFFNNAIALCNKILRHSPGRASVYYKLGKISAQKGFGKDAKVNFLEYADRMQKVGKVDEAFRALTEFADLCPDQDEIRLMLADQLTKAGRKDEAIEQLQILHERYDGDGHTAEAAATATRMRSIDPKVEPRAAAGGNRKTVSGELVFIDLDTPSPARTPRSATPPAPSGRPAAAAPANVPAPTNAGDLSFIIPTPSPPEGVPTVADPGAETIAPVPLTPARATPVAEEPAIDTTEPEETTASAAQLDPEFAESATMAEALFDDQAVDDVLVEESLVVEPVAEETSFEEVLAESSAVEDPVFEESVFEAPALDESTVEEPEAVVSQVQDASPDPQLDTMPYDSTPLADDERSTEPEIDIGLTPADGPASFLSRLTDPGFDTVPPPTEFPPSATRLTDPEFDAVEPLPETPAFATQAYDADVETPSPSIVLDDPLSGMHTDGASRIADDDMGIIKSTPSAPLLSVPASFDDEDAPLTPTSDVTIDGFEPTLLGADPTSPGNDEQALEESVEEQLRASIEGSIAAGEQGTPDDEPDLILPDAIQVAPDSTDSIDLDLSQMVTPPSPARPSRPTPSTARAALEGLPLMDIDVVAAGAAARLSQPVPLPSSGELELVEPPLRDTPLRNPAIASSLTPPLGMDDAESLTIDGVRFAMPTPSSTRKATLVAAQEVTALKRSLESEPENWSLHRQLAEAMLEAGDRYGGISELELAMAGAERSHDLELASSLAEEIARLEPDSVKHHQKRVELAFLTNDRSRLIEAYVALADALLRADQPDKARVVYQRVLDLAPDEMRARGALDTIPVTDPSSSAPIGRSGGAPRQSAGASPSPTSPLAEQRGAFVNLGDWLRDTEAPKDTRMVVSEQEPTGDEQADFADMLRKFKQGVAENVDAEDYQSHYDLAIAFKEMGLLDEAIAEFQKALGSPTNRLPTYEALGQCFMEKSQFKLASSILGRALNEKASEDKLVGVLYLLGRAAEAQGNPMDAVGFYQRVFVLDIEFRDVADRLSSLERAER